MNAQCRLSRRSTDAAVNLIKATRVTGVRYFFLSLCHATSHIDVAILTAQSKCYAMGWHKYVYNVVSVNFW